MAECEWCERDFEPKGSWIAAALLLRALPDRLPSRGASPLGVATGLCRGIPPQARRRESRGQPDGTVGPDASAERGRACGASNSGGRRGCGRIPIVSQCAMVASSRPSRREIF
jgi:hypothetical protein